MPGRPYRYRVWIKADSLEKGPRRRPGLAAVVRFLTQDGKIVRYRGRGWLASKPVDTGPWTLRELSFVPPKGTYAFEPGVVMTVYGEASIDDAKVVPAEVPEWETAEGSVYTVHHLRGDPVDPQALATAERAARQISSQLGVPLPEPLHYYKYPDRETLRYLTGRTSDEFHRLPDEIHTIRPDDRFGIARLLADTGWSPDLKTPPVLSRGLAVALSEQWLGEDPRALARRLAGQRRLPSIARMGLSSGTFSQIHPAAAYAVAGAFVGWLIDRYGLDRFRALYTSFGTQEPGPLFAEKVEEIYGVPLADLERLWRTSLAL